MASKKPATSTKGQRAVSHPALPKPDQIQKILQCDKDDVDDLTNEFYAVNKLYRHNVESSTPLPKRSDRKKDLKRFARHIEGILESNTTVDAVFAGTKEFEELRAHGKTLGLTITGMLSEKSSRGPEPDDQFDWLVGRLANLFLAGAGKSPTIWWNDVYGRFESPFFDFVTLCVGDSRGNVALGGAVRRALGNWRNDAYITNR